MLLDLANPVADKLFVLSSSSYPVQGDCTVQQTVHFTDRKALQRVFCVGYQINRHMTRNQLQSGDAQALLSCRISRSGWFNKHVGLYLSFSPLYCSFVRTFVLINLIALIVLT